MLSLAICSRRPGLLLSGGSDSTLRLWALFGAGGRGGSLEASRSIELPTATKGVLCVAIGEAVDAVSGDGVIRWHPLSPRSLRFPIKTGEIAESRNDIR